MRVLQRGKLAVAIAVFVASFSITIVADTQPASAITYSGKSCGGGQFTDIYWWELLDTGWGTTDYDYCAITPLFVARNGYQPVWAYEANVANDMGLVAVYQSGGCSSSPDTGWAWDFQLPCKAHDLCYDARKAGFSKSISDSDCDGAFRDIMEAHCNDRLFSVDCRLVRDTFYAAVAAPGVVTNPDPAPVSLRPSHAPSKCADVPGSSWSFLVQLQIYTCFGTSNQKFIFQQRTATAWDIKPAHFPSNCLAVNGSQLVQWGCSGLATATWSVWDRYGYPGLYTIRSMSSGQSECWDVPQSLTANGTLLQQYACWQTANQMWYFG